MWITAITDRTKEDVDKVILLNSKVQQGICTDDEMAEWREDLKGAFNSADMERIINNITILDEVLETNLDLPTFNSFPTLDWFSAVLRDIQTLRDAYITFENTPDTPIASEMNSYVAINNAEQILQDIYIILCNNFFHYCGEDFYSGDEIGLLL